MRSTAAVTLASLLASVCLLLGGWGGRTAALHLAFAVGIVPLIFAAMSHFVPVLTRTGDPGRWIRYLPVAAQLAGLLAVAAMAGLLPRPALHAAAAVDLALAAILLRWIGTRAARCLGQPHPGWRWYAAALGCLLTALLVVPAMVALSEWYAPLRLLHLHLNTLGLIGLAALGTLPVLLPTALGQPDPAAASWLRSRLFPALGSIGLIAAGAASAWPLALFGGLVLFGLLGGLLRHWLRQFGWRTMGRDGAAAPLLAAVIGLWLVNVHGLLHAAGGLPGERAILLWATAFLLPLITGALSQLLPVWCLPGPLTPARQRLRDCLVATGRWRALLFLAAGLALTASFELLGVACLGVAMALFGFGLTQAVCVLRSTR